MFFGGSFFKMKISDILNFKWIKYLRKGLSYLKNGGTGVNYCWNYGPLNLLLHFIQYRLDQPNNKHTKTAVNSAIQFFKCRYQEKFLIKVWSFFAHPPQNDGPVRFLRNWTETIFWWLIFSNFTNVRYLFYWKFIIWAKSDLPVTNSVCEKVWFTINGQSKILFFDFFIF